MALLFVCLSIPNSTLLLLLLALIDDSMPFSYFFSFFTCLQQSPQDGIAVSTKERRPEDGRRTHNWRPAASCYNSGWNRTDPWR
jgi:hypothetical protein